MKKNTNLKRLIYLFVASVMTLCLFFQDVEVLASEIGGWSEEEGNFTNIHETSVYSTYSFFLRQVVHLPITVEQRWIKLVELL